jgi:hypothetical protein
MILARPARRSVLLFDNAADPTGGVIAKRSRLEGSAA